MLQIIHHIAIICSDYDAAMRFYAEQLGFDVIRETKRESDRKIDLQAGEYELELFIKADAPKRLSYPEACGLRHVAFKVASVPETVEVLRKRGIQCEAIRLDAITKKPMTFFHDPDGLPLEIHE